MKLALRRSALEILETRIAPAATYFVSGASLEIDNSAGAHQTGDATAATDAHATKAILLSAGDTLFFNPDGDVTTHANDYKWVSVTAGKTLVFFTDLNGDTKFSLDELTGLAVGDKFSGAVFGDVHGSVATMLDSAGKFTSTTLQAASIAKLTVSGALTSSVDGVSNVLSGLGINNVSIGQRYFGTPDGQSVNGVIATGTNAQFLSTSYNGGVFSVMPSAFTVAPGTAGGDIAHVHLSGGVRGLFTGAGQDNPAGPGGAGGSLNDVIIGDSPLVFHIVVGNGGNATGQGAGGAGGSILGFSGGFHTTSATGVIILTGGGGDGSGGNGGAGGKISNSSFRDLDPARFYRVFASDGGNGTGKGAGGAGGSIINSAFTLLGDLGRLVDDGNGHMVLDGGDLVFQTGSGGDAGGTTPREASGPGAGGAGGSWDSFFTTKNPRLLAGITGGTAAAVVTQKLATFQLLAGHGGISVGGVGGAGGSVLGGHFAFAGQFGILADDPNAAFAPTHVGAFLVHSGDAGTGLMKGGDAGRVQSTNFTFEKEVQLDHFGVLVSGGAGGALTGEAGGTGGAGDGGDLTQTILDFRSTVSAFVALTAGAGANASTNVGAGGDGGDLNGIAVLASHAISGAVNLGGGEGGSAGFSLGNGAGGVGGSARNLLIQAPTIGGGLFLSSGTGGAGHGTGAGGNAGDLSTGIGRAVVTPSPLTDDALGAQLRTPAGVYVVNSVDSVEANLGTGGDGGSLGKGGSGGSLLNSKFLIGSVNQNFEVENGGGGGGHQSAAGGLSGRIDTVSINVNGNIGSQLDVAIQPGGPSDTGGKAGSGRNFDHLSILVAGNVRREVSIIAAAGGQSDGGAGAGGSINGLHLDVGDIMGLPTQPMPPPAVVAGIDLAIQAGSGSSGRNGGLGGSITSTTVTTGSIVAGTLITAGSGGNGVNGSGMAGGLVSASTFVFRGAIGGELDFYGGDGGIGIGAVAGGAGGAISKTSIIVNGAGAVNVLAGNAGSGHGGTPPVGGAIDQFTFENLGLTGDVFIQAGAGSLTDTGNNKGGAGGNVSKSGAINAGTLASFTVLGGNGGDHRGHNTSTKGDAGLGGSVTGFAFDNTGTVTAEGDFQAGDGGSVSIDGSTAAGVGGAGGAVSGLVIHDTSAADTMTILGGIGGDGVGTAGKSGKGGAVLTTLLDTPGIVSIFAGDAGTLNGATSAGTGGGGGAVSGVTGRVGELNIFGGRGGDALGGKGGLGGNVDTVNLSQVTGIVRMLVAGDGGDGTMAGGGGSISKIIVSGDIGDFTAAFGFDTNGMGGLIVGQAGAGTGGINGSIATVTAGRIAAILAGRPSADAIDPGSVTNAVTSIKAVTADVIGADNGLAGTGNLVSPRGFGSFTFTDANTNGVYDNGDTAIDGFVLVLKKGLTATSITSIPLDLIQLTTP